LGCGDRTPNEKGPSRSRVDAVAARPNSVEKLSDWCEVYAEAGAGRLFVAPELAGGARIPSGGWRWINVWATWCKPCIEEMPVLAGWDDRLRAVGVEVGLVFLSVDAEEAMLRDFRRNHPDIPSGPRMADVDELGEWLSSIGLDESSVLPIHLFVDGSDRIRCVRMGGVSEASYGTVRRLLGGA
jgi:thiol-disulfide isomerase/thioredoxin